MPSPIIVGLALRDDDDAPLALASRLARLSGLPLVLATALPREMPSRVQVPEYARALRDAAHEKLDAIAARLGEGVEIRTHVFAGSPSGALHELAQELNAAAIVVGSSHRGTVGRLLIGDVAAGLLQGSTCPVVVAPRAYGAEGAGFARVGVAFDGSVEAEAALGAAIGFARQGGGAVQAFTVVEPHEYTSTYIPIANAMAPGVEKAREDWAENARTRALSAMPAGVTGAAEIVHGPAAQALGDLSRDLDLLVCGSRGYGAVKHVLAGSVARGLSHRAACPLVVVPRETRASSQALWSASDDVQATPQV